MRARRSLMEQQHLVRTCLLQADHPNSDENHEVTKRFLGVGTFQENHHGPLSNTNQRLFQ